MTQEMTNEAIHKRFLAIRTNYERNMLQKLAPVQSETAGRLRHCCCGADILKGERCYVRYIKPRTVSVPGHLQFDRRINYCMVCAGKELKTVQRAISLCVADVKRYLKKHPEVENRIILRSIKDGTALQTNPTDTIAAHTEVL